MKARVTKTTTTTTAIVAALASLMIAAMMTTSATTAFGQGATTPPSTASPSSPSTGQGQITSERAQNNQPSRVGVHDNAQQTSGEGARGGSVTDPTLCSQTNNPGCSTTVKPNCFGKVIQHRAQEHKEDPSQGTLGQHTSDPVPEIPGRETPRQGIGNQDQGHPAAHGAFNSQFDPDDEANVVQNC